MITQYPDSCMTQPEMLRKLIQEKIMPETGSSYAKYLDKSIERYRREFVLRDMSRERKKQ